MHRGLPAGSACACTAPAVSPPNEQENKKRSSTNARRTESVDQTPSTDPIVIKMGEMEVVFELSDELPPTNASLSELQSPKTVRGNPPISSYYSPIMNNPG